MSPLPRDSLEDSLASTRQAVADMLDQRDPTFSLPQPFYNDPRLFALDMQNVFEKQWLFAGMSCEIPAMGSVPEGVMELNTVGEYARLYWPPHCRCVIVTEPKGWPFAPSSRKNLFASPIGG